MLYTSPGCTCRALNYTSPDESAAGSPRAWLALDSTPPVGLPGLMTTRARTTLPSSLACRGQNRKVLGVFDHHADVTRGAATCLSVLAYARRGGCVRGGRGPSSGERQARLQVIHDVGGNGGSQPYKAFNLQAEACRRMPTFWTCSRRCGTLRPQLLSSSR